MTTEVITILFTLVKFVLDRVSASNATKEAFQKLIEETVNDGLISQQSHKIFVDQYHDVQGQLNAITTQPQAKP